MAPATTLDSRDESSTRFAQQSLRAPRDGKRAKTLTVTLRAPNTTTLPNTTEADRHFALALLERWGLIAPPPQDVDVTEDF